jgi:hypothetical protein
VLRTIDCQLVIRFVLLLDVCALLTYTLYDILRPKAYATAYIESIKGVSEDAGLHLSFLCTKAPNK